LINSCHYQTSCGNTGNCFRTVTIAAFAALTTLWSFRTLSALTPRWTTALARGSVLRVNIAISRRIICLSSYIICSNLIAFRISAGFVARIATI
jgi:hypothetical protein